MSSNLNEFWLKLTFKASSPDIPKISVRRFVLKAIRAASDRFWIPTALQTALPQITNRLSQRLILTTVELFCSGFVYD
jgi:hypothetical protein